MKPFSQIRRFGVLSALALLVALPASAETRTFTDNQGREIEAEVTGVSGSQVTLRLAGGKSYTIPIAKLSKADQLFVKVWKDLAKDAPSANEGGSEGNRPAVPANVEYVLEFKADKERVKKGIKNKVESGESRRDDWIYEVELENRSRVELEGLEMSYRIYVDAAATAKLSFDAPPKFHGGRTEVDPVKDGESVTVKTKTVTLADLELDAGYVFTDGSRNDLEDKLEGIWIKLWHGDKKVAEYKSNDSTVKKAEWPDDDPADPEAE
jgi:hypothetical protein